MNLHCFLALIDDVRLRASSVFPHYSTTPDLCCVCFYFVQEVFSFEDLDELHQAFVVPFAEQVQMRDA
jgi:hypothetical protein